MRCLLAVLGVAFALGVAVPARADPTGVDASFLETLKNAGISFSDPKNAVDAGRTACGLMGKGKSQLDVVQLVMQQNSGISTVSAAQFTAIAASAYCPQYLKQATSAPQPPGDGVGVSGGQQ